MRTFYNKVVLTIEPAMASKFNTIYVSEIGTAMTSNHPSFSYKLKVLATDH